MADKRAARRAHWILAASLVITTAAGCGGTSSASKPTDLTIACATPAACQAAMSTRHQGSVMLPEAPNMDFVRGWTPTYAKDPTLGGAVYNDTSEGRTISFLAATFSPWANKYGCRSLLGTVVSTPKGLSVCFREPKQGVETITIIDTIYEHDGVFYQMHMDDHRPASPAMSAEDRAWMLDLIDSYR